MSERKLVTVRTICEIKPIPNSDAIECATVDGWNVVVKKGEFNVGDDVLYFEIDSWIPTEIAPFLSKGKEPREYLGVKGEKLRTIRLRGQISQGLILPLSSAGDIDLKSDNLAELLNVNKWDREIACPLEFSGRSETRCTWDSRLPKTDQERVQNIPSELEQYADEHLIFEITEKLEGSSMSVYIDTNDCCALHVCSRNVDLKFSESNKFWSAVTEEMLLFVNDNPNLVLRGELCGPGIQGNIYNLKQPTFFLYDIFDLNSGKYLSYHIRHGIVSDYKLKTVPILELATIPSNNICQSILSSADGNSLLNDKVLREGIVFKNVENGNISFKAISNAYLLGEK